MVFHKIQKGLAIAVATSMVATSVPAGDYRAVLAAAKQEELKQKQTVTLADSNEISENDEGVFKVTMDDTGYLTADNEYAANENTPFSWDNVNMYFVITDRFYNGDPNNDHSYGRSATSSAQVSAVNDIENKEDPAAAFERIAGSKYASKGESGAANYKTGIGTFHGGDLAGLTKYIEDGYFDDLGTDAIWITAPYEQVHGAVCSGGFKHYAYHGYYTLDYTEVDGNMGSAADLEKFIDTAHEHGIRVVFDVVMNHSGYPDGYTIAEYYGETSDLLSSNWRDIYFGTNESDLQWYMDYQNVEQSGGNGIIKYGDAWNSSWFTTSWQRMVAGRYGSGYTGSESGDEITYCSAGLPDFKTEQGSGVSLPDILVKKWTAEGRYSSKVEETNAMLSACGYNSNNATVTNYLVAWLSNWVREYGVDGFRCDTAKHIEKGCWKELKKQCTVALEEWRTENPDKPGAQWNDDFWMTGEVYDHGVTKDGYFTEGGFDSLINFSFQSVGGQSGASLEGTYSSYANSINNDPSFNVLSYISSHDKGLGTRGAGAGTALLLCPGGVQTFYGDETARAGGSGSGDQPSRSQMTWNNEACLSNWQKVGRFRRNHIAVGAGQHTKIADSPYTFSRTYTGKATIGAEQVTDYTDKVVVCLPGSAGTYDVSVGDVFEDGTTLIDEYTGEEYTVSGGQVSVECDNNGVILLAEPAEGTTPTEKAIISASVKSKEYSDDTLSVKITAKNVTNATYQINNHSAVTFDGETEITIGEDTKYGEETSVVVKGTSTIAEDNGAEVTQSYTYTRSAEPTIGGAESSTFSVRVKKSDFDTAPQIYVYDSTHGEANAYTGAWPGKTMTADGDYYVYTNESVKGAVYAIIFTADESWRSTPDMGDPEAISGSVELIKSSKTFEKVLTPVGDPCKVTVNYVDVAGNVLKSIHRVGAAGKDYTVYAPKKLSSVAGYTLADDQKTSVTGTFEEEEKTIEFVYNKDDGTVVPPTPSGEASPTPSGDVGPTPSGDETPTPSGDASPTPDNGDASPTPDNGGASPTPDNGGASPTPDNGGASSTPDNGGATPTPDNGGASPTPDNGGARPTPSGDATPEPGQETTTPGNATSDPGSQMDGTTTATPPADNVNNSGNTTNSTTPTPVPTNTPATNTTGGAVTGAVVTEFEVSMTTDPENTQIAGKKVTIEATSKGLDGDIVYRFEVENSAGIRETIQGYSAKNIATWTPTKAGTFTLLVRAKDKTTGTIATTEKTFKVTAAPLTIKKLSITKVSKLKRKIAISALGGKGKLKYKYTYKFKGKTKVLKKYSTSKSIKATFKKKGKYVITVFVKDTSGKVKKISKTITIKK